MEVDFAYDVFGLVWFGLIIQDFNDNYGCYSLLGVVGITVFCLVWFLCILVRDSGIFACGSAWGSVDPLLEQLNSGVDLLLG